MKKKQFKVVLLLGSFILLLASCSKKVSKLHSVTAEEIVVFPAPPDTARIQFLTSFSTSINITGKRSFFTEFILGKRTERPIIKPYGVTVKNEKIYICDPGIGGLEIVDLKKGSFDYFAPTGLGQLKLPLNCAIDDNNYLYVADATRKQVVVFNAEGKYVNAFGGGDNFKPTDVFVHNNKIWVADMKNGRINIYEKDSTNKLLSNLSIEDENTDTKLYAPSNIYVTDDYIYVSDNGDYKIKKYTHEGKFISAVGGLGKGIGKFARPKGVAVDKDENIFVVDALFENIQIFNNKQQLLMFFGGHYSGPGYMWLPTGITIDYDNLEYFQKFVHKDYKLKYLILVVNQFGPDKINIYGAVESIN